MRKFTTAIIAIATLLFTAVPVAAQTERANVCVEGPYFVFSTEALSETIPVDLPAGRYNVTVTTWDSYPDRPDATPSQQDQEQVSLFGFTTDDLEEGVETATLETTFQIVIDDLTEFTVTHAADHPWNSVGVPSICFEQLPDGNHDGCPEGTTLVKEVFGEAGPTLDVGDDRLYVVKSGPEHLPPQRGPILNGAPNKNGGFKDISHVDLCVEEEPPVTTTTAPPTTEPPTTEPPTTEPPVTEPPTTEPPVTEPPATTIPTTTTEEPTTTTKPEPEEPATTEPSPTTEPPVDEPTTTEPPVEEPPAEDPPTMTELPRTGGTTDLALLGLVLMAGGSAFAAIANRIKKGQV